MPRPEWVFDRLQARPGAIWLDGGEAGDGWSVLAWDPAEWITDPSDWPQAGRSLTRAGRASDLPFSGGCIGYLGYGAGPAVAPVPASAPTPEPPVWLGRYRGALCYRHADRSWHPTGEAGFRREAEAVLAASVPLDDPPEVTPARAVQTLPRAAFEAGVRRILALLEAGDCYQVNLTRAVVVRDAGLPWPAYRRLRRRSPARYGAWIRGDAFCLLSNSPELFLRVQGGTVCSEPVKGTRPRGRDAEADARQAASLLHAAKDEAELTMIVDLVRNDLGRVAVAGTVRSGPRVLRAHSNVHHASRRVEAQLLPGLDAWHALAATFPPGSVTGAPKVRACRRIAELETGPRGAYCGAVGYVSDSGAACWSVAIRTAVWTGADARYHVGGGIVVASDPAAEWEETVVKGRELAIAFGAPPDS